MKKVIVLLDDESRESPLLKSLGTDPVDIQRASGMCMIVVPAKSFSFVVFGFNTESDKIINYAGQMDGTK